MATSDKLIVAAIDFGTTYSGWAFSFKHEFDADPTKVSAKIWTGGKLVSSKGPTCALIKPDGKTLDSFGFEAESKYSELAEGGEHGKWYFFKRFKMMLFDKIGLKRDVTIEDASGRKFPAKTVFSLCIGHLRNDLIKMSEKRFSGGGLTDNDVHWVLTVPAIWNDAAKQFMREAAQECGIPDDKLTIALEPEAASILCRHLPVDRYVGNDKMSLGTFKTGTKYMVLDAGGGTVDITVHEVKNDGTLKELHKASGGAWGGTKVDEAFEQFICKLVGASILKKLKEDHIDDYIDLFRDFEIKKRDITPEKEAKITLRIPGALTDIFEEETGRKLKAAIPLTEYEGKVSVIGDKLRIEAGAFRELFDGPVQSVITHIKGLLLTKDVIGCAAIVMVGGFSESPMLQDGIRNAFPHVKIIIPEEAGLAVLKGAVIFGHNPKTIAERICKYTYGTDVCHTKTENCTHPACSTVVRAHGVVKCNAIFWRYVHVGQTLQMGEELDEQTFFPDSENQTAMLFNIFASSSISPQLTTEPGCNKLGTLSIPMTDQTGGLTRSVGMTMQFGGTEIEVKLVDKTTGHVIQKMFDFLG